MDELLDYLTEPLKHDMYAEATQIRQCRAVFVWIAHHIDYDQELYSNPAKLRQSDQSPLGVLLTRRAVCAGYAGLFQDCCLRLGINCVTIGGFSKGASFNLRTKVSDISRGGIWGRW